MASDLLYSDSGGLRKLLALNMLFSLLVAALSVMVPLYLLSLNVDITIIGLLLSLTPLSFMVIRVILASVADSIGTRRISILYTISNLVAIALYTLVPTSIGLALANLFEGVRQSGFWAVARTDVLSSKGQEDAGDLLANFSNLRQLADGIGRLLIGFSIAYLAFTRSFILLFFVSLILSFLVFSQLKSNPRKNSGPIMKKIFKQHPTTFWFAALLQALVWLPFNQLTGFLIPVYLISAIKLSYQETGTLIALLSLSTAIFAIISWKWHLDKRALFILSFISVPALLIFPYVGKSVLIPLFVLALGLGGGNVIGEYILVDQVYRSRDVSTDIGVLYVPLKLSEFLFLAFSGVVISIYGFAPLFLFMGTCMALFVVLGIWGVRLNKTQASA